MGAPEAIVKLVERFDRQREAYRSGDYNEARLRREFLDPFFAELGWDMDNRRGYAEAYKDVIHEDSIKVGSGTKAPDYCFRIANTRKFFVEAKKPAVNIRDDISPAYQLRRYAWTAKLPVSVLTDFEEFAVYDCRVRPHVEDKASVARTRYLTYPEYLDHWEDIEAVFSHEAVLRGSFDAYADKGKGARGTTEVDDAFLEEIERWRDLLAKNLADRNGQLTQRDLNFAIEVSKLSLVLKVLEGETEESVNTNLKLFHDRALPDLGKNIRHGNSLIGPEFYESGQMRLPMLDDEPMAVFDWHKSFPAIFQDGGFDVVVGNPPYLSYGGRQSVEIPDEVREYYARQYESAGWPTAHSLFLERSIKLLSRQYVSFIVPDQVGHLAGYSSLREIAARETGIAEVRYWGEHVFRGVITPALTMVLDKTARDIETAIFSKDSTEQRGIIAKGQPWNFSPSAGLIERLRTNTFSLGKLVGDRGIRTTAAKEQVVALSEAKGKFVPALEGKVVNRYSCSPPEIAVRLNSKKPLYVSKEEKYESAVYLIRQTASYPIVGPHDHVPHFRNSLLALYKSEDGVDIRYIVALLNSKLLRFVYTETVRESQQRTFPQVKVGALQTLPIRCIDLKDKQERQLHDDLVKLVDNALEVQRRLAAEKNPIRKEALQSNFELIDGQIEQTVYGLYGVSAEDIRFVEASVAGSSAPKEERAKSWRPDCDGPVAGPKRTRGKVISGHKKKAAG